ncbi:(2Fe-2S)-binding protein [Cupriavidus plantarum]|uniref:Carbon-monoxide dehydrogenase small subunit n=1 Tax=Cupriavidus plantarum TaxID=942865 RepID=A0A316F031_9BURK|nr:(2Fe-2S)-binding protein [Cupriavidus plantarum]NYH98511.1 carbon-monoxide dehydrogenase small subunit [Cupriavidus plantarum]PWK37856.1 carbon-monoxide dehydrogenase small subunit [Cupriavidus plantarum]REF01440.1 carbon-monoxide dehydrogenase small subunit [Cupriavidus plantarum]
MKTINLVLNGTPRSVQADARRLLIEVIRDELDTKGARVGCLTGDCGACTVLLDGEVRKACLVLAASIDGNDVRTIEGLDAIEALQQAFVSHNAFQCGFCTSGMLVVAADLLKKNPSPTRDQIRHAISGNLCRCTAYEPIVEAIHSAARIDDARSDRR